MTMKHIYTFVAMLMLSAILLALLAGSAAAQQQGAYLLQRSVIGGASSMPQRGGGYNLTAVVGQPVIGESSATGYTLVSGYAEPAARNVSLYIPLVSR